MNITVKKRFAKVHLKDNESVKRIADKFSVERAYVYSLMHGVKQPKKGVGVEILNYIDKLPLPSFVS